MEEFLSRVIWNWIGYSSKWTLSNNTAYLKEHEVNADYQYEIVHWFLVFFELKLDDRSQSFNIRCVGNI